MIKNKLYLMVALSMLIVLGACAAKPAQAAQNNPGGANYNPANMPLEQKLAIGTLKLEGTPQAVTAKEATDLLPLWQAVKSLSASTNTAPSEITAVYKQIEGVMTPDQTQAIQKITWTQTDLQALMTKYGVTFGGPGGQGGQNLTADQRATRTAQFATRSRNGGGAGGAGGFGGAPGGAPGGVPGGVPGGTGGFGGGQNASGTPIARTPQPGGRGGGGMNTIFVDPLIKLLQTRATGQ